MMGEACRNAQHRSFWWVTQYMCNHSAFNGYHQTPSDYSEVKCSAPESEGRCGDAGGASNGRSWRTKAGYVHDLPKRAPKQTVTVQIPADGS